MRDPAYQLAWIKQRRLDWIRENGPCARCGTWENLEVDHRDARDKLYNVTVLWSLALNNPKRIVELAKCQVLCESCHQWKTKARKEYIRGEACSQAKINGDIVRQIRSMFAEGNYSKRALARRFGIDEKNVRLIIARKAWAHIE